MEAYLIPTEIIDWDRPEILSLASDLAKGRDSDVEIARACFEWVRDRIKHIGDYDIQTVAVTASEVLAAGSGICYAKSHLLAALLRARGNRADINARFSPPKERLAFSIRLEGERDLPGVRPDPHPAVIQALPSYPNRDELWKNLPDVDRI